jgi:hypothetical protein
MLAECATDSGLEDRLSFDYAVWHETTPITDEDAHDKYLVFATGTDDVSERHPRTDEFLRSLHLEVRPRR